MMKVKTEIDRTKRWVLTKAIKSRNFLEILFMRGKENIHKLRMEI